MTRSDRLRIGIIGIGMMAIAFHVPALKATGRAELVAISRRNPEALAEAKELLGVAEACADWREMLDRSRLDAVIVATSHSSHAEPTIAALERGLPVLVEKPLAATSENAWAMVRASERTGKTLMVAEQFRCQGSLRTAKRLITEGAIGAVEQVALVYAGNSRWKFEGGAMPADLARLARQLGIPPAFLPQSGAGHWRGDPQQMGGGELADTGAHLTAVALWLGGAPPSTVVALSEPKGKPAERYIAASARLKDGVIASVMECNGTELPARLTVIGDRGAITGEWSSFLAGPDLWLQVDGKREQVVPDCADLAPVAAFIATVLDGRPNLSPAEDAAHAVEFTEAAYRSALEESVITVGPPERPRPSSSPSSAPFSST